MNLRAKLTITLLITGLATAATVGGVAYWMLMRDFRQSALNEAFDNFSGEIVRYISTYGSWNQASRQEPFHRFVTRTRVPVQAQPGKNAFHPPPDVTIDRGGAPPFLFMILDPQGKVLKPAEGYQTGQYVSDRVRENALPIWINNEVEVLASPIGHPNLTQRDKGYLAAMRQSLVTGILFAIVLSLLIGLVVARRIGVSLKELTVAIRAMENNGELEQRVPVRSSDEIGVLSEAFNRMSRELSKAHSKLRQTNETIHAQAAQLLELSTRDPLTEIYNRRHFKEQATRLYDQAVRYKHPFSVMVGDLDHFKLVNDTYSHATGDDVLRKVAQLLAMNTRKTDIVARYGGEEFVVAFAESSLQQAAQCCEELRLCIETYHWQEIHPDLRVTMSMGISDNLSLGSLELLMAEADRRLYEAKRRGRNRLEPVISTQMELI